MTLTQDVLPSDFIEQLRTAYPGLKSLPFEHQFELARMVWGASIKGRFHKHFDDALSFHYADLDEAFGRGGFSRINDQFQFFDVSTNWSVQDGWTRGYRFSAKLEEFFGSYQRACLAVTTLLRADGTACRTPYRAIGSKDLRGSNATRWPSCPHLNQVPVSIGALEELRSELLELLEHSVAPERDHYKSRLNRWLAVTAFVLRMSLSTSAGRGYMAHRYIEAESGRLYAQGLSLQNAPRLVKTAALDGTWEYDFSNCHYTIFEQMCRRQGYNCIAISDYLNAKNSVREAIAEKARISIAQAKECLIAIMYGASTTLWHKNAIPMAIGVDAAKRLFSVPIFRALRQEIKGGAKAVLSSWPRQQNGRLCNEVGKAIVPSAGQMQKMAHLIQGVEARALKCALELFPEEILLLQHDGFAARSRLDTKAVSERVSEVTGYQLLLEEVRLRFAYGDVGLTAQAEELNENRKASEK